MDLSSQNFLFIFLPIVYAAYCLVGVRMRGVVLLLASLYFYACGGIPGFLVFAVFLFLNYFFGIGVDRCLAPEQRRQAITVAVAANLGILVIFKYLGFFGAIFNAMLQPVGVARVQVPQFAIPLGLSFLTFQAIAYLMDVYHQEISPERSLLKFTLAFAFFPKLVAGPIVRMDQIQNALERPEITLDDFVAGFKRIIIGLGKKLILAESLAKAADQVFAIPLNSLTTPVAWLGIICYTLQLYFDFSGYTDMAIGIGRLFGYALPENFNFPYRAKSLTEFWRRWHISLSTWFRDYLYTPLSYALMTEKVRLKVAQGRYKTNYRALFSIFVVFTLCGLWHGANWNFLIWGMLHGLFLTLESWKFGKVLKKCWPPLAHLYLVLVVMFCWVFFRIPVFVDALRYLKALSGFGPAGSQLTQLRVYTSIELLLVLAISLICAFPVATVAKDRFETTFSRLFTAGRTWQQVYLFAEAVMIAAIFLVSLQALSGAVSKPFIYAQF
jgi:alginate O-acetyltransferase complex protein AlgI